MFCFPFLEALAITTFGFDDFARVWILVNPDLARFAAIVLDSTDEAQPAGPIGPKKRPLHLRHPVLSYENAMTQNHASGAGHVSPL